MIRRIGYLAALAILLSGPQGFAGPLQQITGQDLDQVLEKADKLLEEAKHSYEEARTKSAVAAFVDAGFKLEEARIKYMVLQEIGAPDKQKVAADRLRAVNQLSKLIHDGKVAISGAPEEKPVEAPLPKASDAPREEFPKPEPSPAKSVSEAIARLPVPDAAKQREAEKLVKDLFREQYAKKAPADRQILAKALLQQAAKTLDDSAAAWVLFHEAQDAFAQVGDVKQAVFAVEESARVFDIDPLSLKNAAIASSAKAAKTPEDFVALTEASLKLVDEYVATDQYDAADKAMTAALQHARRTSDVALAGRTSGRAKEVTEAKALFQAMKRVLETLARNSVDPTANSEMGQYLAFAKGNWDLGLRFLSKGPEAVLKELATKEISLPTQAVEQAAIADGWWDLAAKEKNTLRKSQMTAHALSLYELALAGATGLVRTKIQKRLDDFQESRLTGVNLLRLIDPAQDALAGDWVLEGRRLLTPMNSGSWQRIQIPYAAPAEYDVVFGIQSVNSYLGIRLGLPLGGDRQCMVVIGGDEGRSAGLEMIDNRSWNDKNPTYGPMPPGLRSATILCSLRKSSLTISVEGKRIIDWKDLSQLSNFPNWGTPNRNVFFLATSSPRAAITQIQLTPITGQGKRLR